MKFPEIFEGLKEGKKYRRADWDIIEYIRIGPRPAWPDDWIQYTKFYDDDIESSHYEYTVDARDWFADDWEEVE